MATPGTEAGNKDLVSIARSKPLNPYENKENGGVPTKRARGVRFEVPPDLVHEIPEEDSAGENSGACARLDQTGMRGAECGDRAGSGMARSHPSVGGPPAGSGTGEVGAVYQRDAHRG